MNKRYQQGEAEYNTSKKGFLSKSKLKKGTRKIIAGRKFAEGRGGGGEKRVH